MDIQVLGTGCLKCKQLEENVRKAAPQARVEKITDLNKILSAGVMMTPALVVDGKIVSQGKVLSSEEIKKLLK